MAIFETCLRLFVAAAHSEFKPRPGSVSPSPSKTVLAHDTDTPDNRASALETLCASRSFGGRISNMTPEPALICLGCWQNLHLPIPLRGPLSAPFRLFGIKPSRMNPNTCTICEMAFSKVRSEERRV